MWIQNKSILQSDFKNYPKWLQKLSTVRSKKYPKNAFKKISKECVQKISKSAFKKNIQRVRSKIIQSAFKKNYPQCAFKKYPKSAFKIYSFQIFNCMNKSQWEILYILIIYLVYFYNLEIFGYSEFGF